MKENNSSVKRSQSRDASSVATFENSSSPKSSPLRDLYTSSKERIIYDPKFSNDQLFEKKIEKININHSLNIKPNNGSIYLTGIGNVNDIRSELYKNIDSISLDFPDLSKSVSKKNSKVNINHKSSLGALPQIPIYSYHHRKGQIAPIFSCCDQELRPKVLNEVYFNQKEKESRNGICKTVESSRKIISKPHHPGKLVVRDGKKDYINKTRELNRIKYCMNLREESIKEYNKKIREQMKSLDYTINSINSYKNNLENKYINEFTSQLRALDKAILTKKLEDEKLQSELVKLEKENYNLLHKINKNELNKNYIEKWIALQIYIKEGIIIDQNNISNYISEKYNDKLIFDTPEEFNEIFKKNENKNINLMKSLNIINAEKAKLYQNLKEIKESSVEDKELTLKILEKEKLLSLLKIRYNDLLKDKKEVVKISKNSSIIEDSSAIVLPSMNYIKNKNKDRNSKNIINFSNIYKLIQEGFDYIVENDIEVIEDLGENFLQMNYINNNIMVKSTKALSQMRIMEMCYIYLFYYKENNKEKNKEFYKNILEIIDLNKKKMKSEKHKKEEEKRALELYKKLEAKKDRIIFKPTRQDNYSSLIYIEKMKKEERKKNKNVKKEIDIYDFLYDLDEDKKEEK